MDTKWMAGLALVLAASAMIAAPAEAATHVRVSFPTPTIIIGGQPAPPPPPQPVVVEERVIYVERPVEEVRYVEAPRHGRRVVYVRGRGPDRHHHR